MKYLKRYESVNHHEFYQNLELDVNPIINTINDILLDITDGNEWDVTNGKFSPRSNSFKVDVKPIGPLKDYNDKLGILIEINKQDGFIRSQDYEVTSRINDYLKSEDYVKRGTRFDGYKLSIVYRWLDKSKPMMRQGGPEII